MTQKTKRSDAQKAADSNYETKRATETRFGGRCTEDEKKLIQRVMVLAECDSEKETIFKALSFYEANHTNE